MKKVMIGILILIPIIILLVVAMVSSIVSAQAHIAVENIELKYKDSDNTIYELPLNLENVAGKVINLKDYLNVVVSPQKANNYTIEWKISGDITYTASMRTNTISTKTIRRRARKCGRRQPLSTKTETKRHPTRPAKWSSHRIARLRCRWLPKTLAKLSA